MKKIGKLFFALSVIISQFIPLYASALEVGAVEEIDYYHLNGKNKVMNVTMNGYLTQDSESDYYVLDNENDKDVMFSALVNYDFYYELEYCIDGTCKFMEVNPDGVLSSNYNFSNLSGEHNVIFNLYTYVIELEEDENGEVVSNLVLGDKIDSTNVVIYNDVKEEKIDEEEVSSDDKEVIDEDNDVTLEDDQNETDDSDYSFDTDEKPEIVISGDKYVLDVALSDNIEVRDGEYFIPTGESISLSPTYTMGELLVYMNGDNVTNGDNTYNFSFDSENEYVFDFILYTENEDGKVVYDNVRAVINTYYAVGTTYDDNNFIKSISLSTGFLDKEFNKENNYYVISVSSDVNEVSIYGALESELASAFGFGTYTLDGDNTLVSVVVTAQDGSVRTYTFEIVRDSKEDFVVENTSNDEVKEPVYVNTMVNKVVYSNDSSLSNIEIEGYSIDFNKNTYEYSIDVPSNVVSLNISATLSDSKASYAVYGNNDFKAGKNIVTIVVTAQNGSTSTYTINVNKEEKKSVKVDDTKDSDSSNGIVKTIIIVLIVLVIIGLIYLIFKDDDEDVEDKNEEYKPEKINNAKKVENVKSTKNNSSGKKSSKK